MLFFLLSFILHDIPISVSVLALNSFQNHNTNCSFCNFFNNKPFGKINKMVCIKLQQILKEIAILKSKFHFLIIPVNNVWYLICHVKISRAGNAADLQLAFRTKMTSDFVLISMG